MSGFAVQRTDRESLFADKCVEQRRFSSTDATENGNMQMPVLKLVEHRLNGIVIVRQRFTNTIRKARVIDKLAQAFSRETQVPCTLVDIGLSWFFRPAPFWQCGERPLPNAH